MTQLVFDGHNDVLFRLWNHAAAGGDPIAEFIDGVEKLGIEQARKGHVDMVRAKAGGLAGGLCAIYITSGHVELGKPDASGRFTTPLPSPLERPRAVDIALEKVAIACRIERAGGWRLCRTTADIRAAMVEGKFAAVLHMEGCEAIDAGLVGLETFYAAGLRSLGPVWSRPNVFGHGVPFAYPSSPDTGPGLTDAGKDLVRACNRMGIVVDLSHMNEKGFWDVAAISDQPLVATHSNVHAITPSARNLTERQLDAIRDSGGIVGLNFAVSFLREDGQERADTGLATMVRHIDHLVEKLGIDGVALGSDYDGATIPVAIGDAGGLQNLVAALSDAGYGDAELTKICRENWLRILALAWREAA